MNIQNAIFHRRKSCENVTEKEAASVTCDGFSIVSSKNVILDRCFTYTSDDALVLCPSYNDGRAQFFRPTFPERDNAIENVVVRSSFIFGGFGVSWIPYGTNATNLYNQEIRNIKIYDCSLGGHKSTGSWPDDPFYGWSSYYSYTQTEDNNYVSIKDVTYQNNEYLAEFNLTIYNIAPKFTNLLVLDNVKGTIYSSSKFLNGNFDRFCHNGNGFKDEATWISGLSYWSERPTSNGKVGTVKIGTKNSSYVDTGDHFIQDNYAGYIEVGGELFQGLYLQSGKYKLAIKTKNVSNNATIFARNAVSGKIIAEKNVEKSDDFEETILLFEITANATVQLGIRLDGSDNEIIYLDDASVEKYNGEIPIDRPTELEVPKTGSSSLLLTASAVASLIGGALVILYRKRGKMIE